MNPIGLPYWLALEMQLDLEICALRSFRQEDAAEIARHANNRNVSMQLRDRFPYPYALDDARKWIASARGREPERNFAITVNDLPIGSIAVELQDDVERCSAKVGYWLGESYWGRGIATVALSGFTRFAFEAYDLQRLFADVFVSNPGSCRVLEKAGYRREARMRRSAIKDGIVRDRFLYAIVREDLAVTAGAYVSARGAAIEVPHRSR